MQLFISSIDPCRWAGAYQVSWAPLQVEKTAVKIPPIKIATNGPKNGPRVHQNETNTIQLDPPERVGADTYLGCVKWLRFHRDTAISVAMEGGAVVMMAPQDSCASLASLELSGTPLGFGVGGGGLDSTWCVLRFQTLTLKSIQGWR